MSCQIGAVEQYVTLVPLVKKYGSHNPLAYGYRAVKLVILFDKAVVMNKKSTFLFSITFKMNKIASCRHAA